MEKAIKILSKIGMILAIFMAVLTLFSLILFFIISSPMSYGFIYDGISKGEIIVDIIGTIEEKVIYVQHIFLIGGIIFTIAFALFLASNVFNFLAERRNKPYQRLVATILSGITFNIPSLLGYIFYYSQLDKDVVNLGDKDY